MNKITKKQLLYSLYIFLCARAGFSGLAPFGVAAFAAVQSSYNLSYGHYNIIIYAIICIFGSFTTGILSQILITSFSVLIYIVVSNMIVNKNSDDILSLFRASIVLVISITIPTILLYIITKPTIMDIINLMIQGIITFVMFFIFRIAENSISNILDSNTTSNRINNEELICLSIIAVIAFMGFPSIIIFGLSIRNIISLTAIMLISLNGNIGTGAASGIMIGILTNSSSPLIICIFGFCGFIAGLLNKFGKIGIVSAFALGNLILCFMFGASKELVYSMYEIAFAAIIFAILPKKLNELIKIPFIEENGMYNQKTLKKENTPIRYDYVGKIKNKAIEKAKLYSNTMNEMSNEFLDYTTSYNLNKKEDSSIARILTKVCGNCRLKNECWKRDYKSRENTLIKCKNIIIKNNNSKEEANRILSEFCIKTHELLEELRIGIEIQRIEKICNSKIIEGRNMIVKQLSEIGNITADIAEDIKFATEYDIDKEKKIINLLKKNEIYVFDVIVVSNKLKQKEIYIYSFKNYNNTIINKISKLLSKITNHEMDLVYKEVLKNKKDIIEMKFTPKPKININIGVKCIPAKHNNISGDSYSYFEYDNSLSYLTLSDGMGTGDKANIQSSTVIRIMDLFLKSNMNISSAASTIDMMLSTLSNEVNTATVDFCAIDKYNKKLQFIKMGAMPSLIINDNEIKEIEINMLPAGINSDFHDLKYKIIEHNISPGDYIVMLTDGIYDGFQNAGISKQIMYEYIASTIRKINCNKFSYQTAADEISNKVYKLSDGTDDISIIILSINDNL